MFRLTLLFALAIALLPGQNGMAKEPEYLSLETAVARALKYNRNQKNAGFDLDDSGLNLEAANDIFRIKVDPLSSINYSSGRERENTIWQVGGRIRKKFTTGVDLRLEPSVEKVSEDYEAGIGFSLAVPLLRNLGKDSTMNNVYAQEYSLGSAQRALHRQSVNTVLDTVSEVYLLIEGQQLVGLYEDQLNILRSHLQSTLIRQRAGMARSMDVFRAEIRINEVEGSLNQARQRVADSSDRLKDIIALPFDQPVFVSAPLEYTFINLEPDKAVQIALDKRIEMSQARADIQEAKRRVKVAKHNTLPDLRLEIAYTRKGISDDLDSQYIVNEDFWSAGLTSSTDLARSAEKTAWRKSRIALNRQMLSFDTVQKNIAQEVRTVLHSLDKSKDQIILQREQINRATGKQKLAQIKFQYNEADNFDLIEAQGQLERARINLMSDEIRYIINGYRLRASLGTLIAHTPENTK